MAEKGKDLRVAALARFATAITLFNVLGHTVFGFEQSWLQPFVGVGVAYACDLLLEAIQAWSEGRRPRYLGGLLELVKFLLPAHITGLAVTMLIYPNERLTPVAFGATVAIASKYVFRVTVAGRKRHFFNPSNLGISATLLVFPFVGLVPPYHFTENLHRVGDWLLPAIIFASGSFLNAVFTKKVPLIAAWLTGFALQGVVRALVFDTPVAAALNPMTGLAFVLFTFYMISDPSTTPVAPRHQVAFGAGVAAVYGLLLAGHVVFTLFLALSTVCLLRGGGLWAREILARRAAVAVPPPAAAPVPVPAQPPEVG
jgi:hypothetical protein